MDQAAAQILVGIFFLGIGLYLSGNVVLFRLKGVLFLAKVVSMHKEDGFEGPIFRPEYELIADQSELRTKHLAGKRVKSKFGMNPATHTAGDVVKVFYLGNANRVASIKEQFWVFTIGVLFIVLGLAACVDGYSKAGI